MRKLAILIALVAAFGAHGVVFADATPVQLVLTYLPGVSNTGSESASGIAELVLPEGEVRVSATELDHLDENNVYVAWVINTETNEFFRLGDFNVKNGNNSIHYEQVLPDAIPNKHWNLLLVTIEKDAEAARPGDKHVVAGIFPRGEHEPPPAVLPNTGGLADAQAAPMGSWLLLTSPSDRLALSGLAALIFSLGVGAGYGVGRRRT